MSAVLFFIAAIGALAGAIGVVVIRNPFYSVLALVCHLIALAALFLLLRAEFVAAAQVIVYAGAVMVLYVFVVAYIGGADTPLHRPGSALQVPGAAVRAGRGHRAVHRHAGHGAEGHLVRGCPLRPGLRHARAHRHAVLDHVPVPVRDRLAAAAGGGDRRRRAGPPPPRPGARRRVRGAAAFPPLGVHRHHGRGRRLPRGRRDHDRRPRADRADRRADLPPTLAPRAWAGSGEQGEGGW